MQLLSVSSLPCDWGRNSTHTLTGQGTSSRKRQRGGRAAAAPAPQPPVCAREPRAAAAETARVGLLLCARGKPCTVTRKENKNTTKERQALQAQGRHHRGLRSSLRGSGASLFPGLALRTARPLCACAWGGCRSACALCPQAPPPAAGPAPGGLAPLRGAPLLPSASPLSSPRGPSPLPPPSQVSAE